MRLREIERKDIPEINKMHNDETMSKYLGGGGIDLPIPK